MSEEQRIQLSQRDLERASAVGLLRGEQIVPLWQFLAREQVPGPAAVDDRPRFSFTHVLYYLAGAAGDRRDERVHDPWLAALRRLGCVLDRTVLHRRGVAADAAVRGAEAADSDGDHGDARRRAVPLATWAVQHAMGLWPPTGAQDYRVYHAIIDWRWLMLELVTLATGCALLYRWRAPFMLMPIAVTLWYMSMDLAMLLLGLDAGGWSEGRLELPQVVLDRLRGSDDPRGFAGRPAQPHAAGLFVLAVPVRSDDLLGWPDLAGVNALAGKLIYLAINLLLVLTGAVLVRRTFTVFGAIGIATVLGDLSWRFFKDSWLFPIALTLIGLAIIYTGIWWSRNEARLSATLRALLPSQINGLLERRAA